MTSDSLNIAQAQYQTGKAAFERGDYRQSVQTLEKASALLAPNSALAGEVRLWLVTAYEAAGQKPEAIALCKQLTQHPDYLTRQQSRRLLYILEAPQLVRRPEWMTEIPDLNALQESNARDRRAAGKPAKARSEKPRSPFPDPVDPTKVNTRDNLFLWVALGAAGVVLLGLVWFS